MTHLVSQLCLHRHDASWLTTPEGQPRGFIQPHRLEELWFHTGTICNLQCPFCLEGSKPGDTRLQQVTLDDVAPVMAEALELGVEQFSFTGGEPFVNRAMVQLLDHALTLRPCLVLTNGTKPLRSRIDALLPLRRRPYPVRFRVSLDHPDPARHDAARGRGAFAMALETLRILHDAGFRVSVARLAEPDEDSAAVHAAYHSHFTRTGLPLDTPITVFPDFLRPESHPDVPPITEHCMTTYHTEASRRAFMCSYSKMVVKREGRLRVYACTLVDDDEAYDLGASLRDSMGYRIMLKHHRCFACFAKGASCSER